MNAREDAISDCKYAKSLGKTALMQHFLIWSLGLDPNIPTGFTQEEDDSDREYQLTILEIQSKLNTPECLLGN
jgi:hypothetical protein